MYICSVCGSEYKEGMSICRRCGSPLKEAAQIARTTLSAHLGEELLASLNEREQGTDLFEETDNLVLEIGGTPLVLNVREQITLGREAPQLGLMHMVDLTPFGGYRQGVSRRHCQIQRLEDILEIIDLGSGNGTFLNGYRLTPNQHYRLHDNDIIHLGTLRIAVYFQKKAPVSAG